MPTRQREDSSRGRSANWGHFQRTPLAFSGADGLQLVALRPGLLVMDSVSDGGDLRARVSIFEAEPTAVADVIDGAVEDGDMQVLVAQFTGADRSLRRQDLTVTGEGVADLECIAQERLSAARRWRGRVRSIDLGSIGELPRRGESWRAVGLRARADEGLRRPAAQPGVRYHRLAAVGLTGCVSNFRWSGQRCFVSPS